MVTAVCEPSEGFYSETFIRAHIRDLPPPVLHLSGGHPVWSLEGRKIIPTAFRAAEFLGKRLPQPAAAAARKACSRRLAAFFRRRGVNVVLAEYGTTAVELMDACRWAGVALVAHFHGADAYRKATLREHEKTYPEMFQQAAAVIGVSRAMERQLLQLGAPRERLFYNCYGIDLQAFPSAEPGANEPLFVGVGRFVDKKAPHLTLLAFARALRETPRARLVLIGDGPLWNACRVMVDALGLSESVMLTGRQTPEEISAWMRKARAFVQHSLIPEAGEAAGDSEGTPLAVLEAGASGLPVIATRHAGIPDAVADGVSGILCAEKDIVTMAEAIATLAADPVKAAGMGAAGRKRIVEGFSQAHSIGRLNRILESAAAGRVRQLWESGEVA